MRAGKLVPAHREWAIAYCAADPQGFSYFVARQPAILRRRSELRRRAARWRLAHRGARTMLSATELAICSQLGVSAADFVKRKNGRADFLSLNKDRRIRLANPKEHGDRHGGTD